MKTITRKGDSMSIDSVRNHLSQFGLQDQILEFDTSSATVELAAKALNCKPERIAKTLSFLLDDGPIVIVTAGDQKIDNKKYRATFHKKAKMIPFDQVELLTGHEVGGVCPFGLNEGIKVYLDESLKRFETVFPACGSHNSAIELSCAQLEEILQPEWVDVCKSIA